MASLLECAAYAMRGGWRTDFAIGSFRGLEYDKLAASLSMRPECARLLDRAASSGSLHGDAVDDFPLETALHSVRLLLGERPCGTLVVAREQLTRLVPVPATLDYAIAVTRSDDGVTYTVALPGTTFGNTPVQLLTDLNPLCSTFDLAVDGRVYTHNFWAGFYASVAAGAEPPVVRILKALAAAVSAVNESGEAEHRLVLTGYSLGATQAMLLAMIYCDDAMQRKRRFVVDPQNVLFEVAAKLGDESPCRGCSFLRPYGGEFSGAHAGGGIVASCRSEQRVARAAQTSGAVKDEDSGCCFVDDREGQATVVAGPDDPVRDVVYLGRPDRAEEVCLSRLANRCQCGGGRGIECRTGGRPCQGDRCDGQSQSRRGPVHARQ